MQNNYFPRFPIICTVKMEKHGESTFFSRNFFLSQKDRHQKILHFISHHLSQSSSIIRHRHHR